MASGHEVTNPSLSGILSLCSSALSPVGLLQARGLFCLCKITQPSASSRKHLPAWSRNKDKTAHAEYNTSETPTRPVERIFLGKPSFWSWSAWWDVTRSAASVLQAPVRLVCFPQPLSLSRDYTSYALPASVCAALWPISFCLLSYCRLRAVPDPIVFDLPAFPAWRTRISDPCSGVQTQRLRCVGTLW